MLTPWWALRDCVKGVVVTHHTSAGLRSYKGRVMICCLSNPGSGSLEAQSYDYFLIISLKEVKTSRLGPSFFILLAPNELYPWKSLTPCSLAWPWISHLTSYCNSESQRIWIRGGMWVLKISVLHGRTLKPLTLLPHKNTEAKCKLASWYLLFISVENHQACTTSFSFCAYTSCPATVRTFQDFPSFHSVSPLLHRPGDF